jgi:methylated-DNA-[protein]-cysteine S-methyltransferase
MTTQASTTRGQDQLWFGEIKPAPLGAVWAAVSPDGLRFVQFGVSRREFERTIQTHERAQTRYTPAEVLPYLRQIQDYLAGERQAFDLAIDWSAMTPFQRQVRKTVAAIPYGQTRAYGEIAAQLGNPNAPRAVGRANASNPMPLVIPCHRVIGADGALRGYGGMGGVRTKRWLLDLERAN